MTGKPKKRTSDFHIRMTEEERANLDGIAGALGLTRSELVRYLAQLPSDALRPGSRRVVYLDKKALALIHREMRRYGTNFNQATHAMNAIALKTRRSQMRDAELREAFDAIEAKLDSSNENQRRVLAKLTSLENAMFVR